MTVDVVVDVKVTVDKFAVRICWGQWGNPTPELRLQLTDVFILQLVKLLKFIL